jgi:hypothetical protein
MKTYPVSTLEVIGFTEVPAKQPPLPRVLSAIYRDPESGAVLYPPYLLDGNDLINPVTAEIADFEERVDLGEVTRFDQQPAKFGWALWLDDLGQVYYSPLSQITRNLTAISEEHIQSARDRIAAQDYSAARTHALIADAANPQHPHRLILRAAAEFRMAERPADYPDAQLELQFTEALASKRKWPSDAFRTRYLKEATSARPDSSKLTNATTIRPAKSRFFADSASR